MAQRQEIAAVYAAGVVQGVALVTFPAASAIFTSPQYYRLSSTAYGGMFLPQAVMAVAAPLVGARLVRRLGIKRVYRLGLVANLLPMGLLVASQFVRDNGIARLRAAAVGHGQSGHWLRPDRARAQHVCDRLLPRRGGLAVLILNALLGLGTALAPVFVTLFVELGDLVGIAAARGRAACGLLLFSMRLPLQIATTDRDAPGQKGGAAGRRASGSTPASPSSTASWRR